MRRKGINDPNKGKVRRFVETYFGQGYASARITTNPQTMDEAHRKLARALHKIAGGSAKHSAGFAATNPTRTKHIVFVNKVRAMRGVG